MPFQNMEDKIKSLEERISKLESNITKLFGKSYRSAGDTQSDLLLKTRGNIKVQYNNSFVDLFKDGKIALDTKNIKVVDELESGTSIQITPNKVYLVYDDIAIELASDYKRLEINKN